MKTSKFLTMVLNRFHDGKSYTTTPNRLTWRTYFSNDRVRASYKGRNNLKGMVNTVSKNTGVKPTRAILAICNSLGHSNFDGFATSKNVKFAAVRDVLKAAIAHSRANGD
mgnify:CR=1